jgi:hypothetical protein
MMRLLPIRAVESHAVTDDALEEAHAAAATTPADAS